MKYTILDCLTPRATIKTRLFYAAFFWTLTAFLLVFKGILALQGNSLLLITVLIGTFAGILKSRFILDKVAAKIVSHIKAKPTRSCLGGMFSIWNWALIFLMFLFGRIINSIKTLSEIKTIIYLMIGIGLGFSSRKIWVAWKNTLLQSR